jgi:hypothetical protein
VLGTGIIKVKMTTSHLMMSLLWTDLGIIYFLSLSWSMLIWMFFFASLVREFLTLLASLFVAFLALEKSIKLISLLLNLM